jgi:hypothetical protein
MLGAILLQSFQILAIEMIDKDGRRHGKHDDKGLGYKLGLQFDIIEYFLICEEVEVGDDVALVVGVVDCSDLPLGV